MTGLEKAGRGGNQLFSKAFSTQASGLLWTCTQAVHKCRDTTDFSRTTPPATARAVSNMSLRTPITAGRDTDRERDRRTTHCWTTGETPRLLDLQT